MAAPITPYEAAIFIRNLNLRISATEACIMDFSKSLADRKALLIALIKEQDNYLDGLDGNPGTTREDS